MSKFIIKIGRTWSTHIRFELWVDKYAIRKRISFDYSCKSTGDEWNDLFGIGYIFSSNKAKFVWRYNKDTNKIAIACCAVVDGSLDIEQMCEVAISFPCRFELLISINSYSFQVIGNQIMPFEKTIPHNGVGAISYPISPSLAVPAAKDVEISIKNL